MSAWGFWGLGVTVNVTALSVDCELAARLRHPERKRGDLSEDLAQPKLVWTILIRLRDLSPRETSGVYVISLLIK
jgi:hypothetical protein